MTLSFLVFPGVLQAKPLSYLESDDWNNVLVVGLFNIFDVVGRTLGGLPSIMISSERRFWLHSFAFARLLIVTLAILVQLGVFSGSQETQNTIVILDPFLLAITNGYVQTIFACYAAAAVSKTDAQEGHSLALGNLLGIAITLGISMGGLLQIPFA